MKKLNHNCSIICKVFDADGDIRDTFVQQDWLPLNKLTRQLILDLGRAFSRKCWNDWSMILYIADGKRLANVYQYTDEFVVIDAYRFGRFYYVPRTDKLYRTINDGVFGPNYYPERDYSHEYDESELKEADHSILQAASWLNRHHGKVSPNEAAQHILAKPVVTSSAKTNLSIESELRSMLRDWSRLRSWQTETRPVRI